MQVRSITRYARISPLKCRDVVREIRGLPVSQALDILNFTPKKAAILVGNTLRSAIANAENNFNLDPESLVVSEAQVGEGPRLKRIKPVARGSAHPIIKRTSHIRIVVTDEAEIPQPRERGKKSAKPKAAQPAPAETPAETTAEA